MFSFLFKLMAFIICFWLFIALMTVGTSLMTQGLLATF